MPRAFGNAKKTVLLRIDRNQSKRIASALFTNIVRALTLSGLSAVQVTPLPAIV